MSIQFELKEVYLFNKYVLMTYCAGSTQMLSDKLDKVPDLLETP